MVSRRIVPEGGELRRLLVLLAIFFFFLDGFHSSLHMGLPILTVHLLPSGEAEESYEVGALMPCDQTVETHHRVLTQYSHTSWEVAGRVGLGGSGREAVTQRCGWQVWNPHSHSGSLSAIP